MPNNHAQVNGHKRSNRPHHKGRSVASGSRAESRRQEPTSSRAASAVGTAARALVGAGKVQGRTQGAIDEQRRQVAGGVHKVRDALRGASQLVRNDYASVARYLDHAGQKAEDVAHYIGNADLRTLRSDVQRVARENPAWFVGGAFVAGLVIGRLFKASTPTGSAEPEIELDAEDIEGDSDDDEEDL